MITTPTRSKRLDGWQIVGLVVCGTLLLAGAAVLAVGLGGVIHQQRWEDAAVATQGVVVGNESRPSSDGTSDLFHAQIEFTTGAGERVEFTDGVGFSSTLARDTGDLVDLRYESDDPRGTVRIWSFWRAYLVWTVLAGVGLLSVLAAIVAAILIVAIPRIVRHRRAAASRIT